MQERNKQPKWLIRMHYQMRSISFAMVFGATALHISERGYGSSHWLFFIVVLLVYPQLQYLRSRNAIDPYRTEMRNLLVDSVLLGVFIVLVKFSSWLTFSVAMGALSNNAANKGQRGLRDSLLAITLGLGIGGLGVGFNFSPDTSWPTTVFCMVGLGGYLLAMNNIGFSRNNQLRIVREQLQVKERETAEANTTKIRFLAAASHDLRQPIHAQGLLLSILESTELSGEQNKLVTHIRSATTATSEMLDTLLDFSRIEAGAVSPVRSAFQMQPILKKIADEFSAQASSKGLSCRARGTDVVIFSDPMLIEIILRNLVSNALRYTNHGGVLLACRRQGDVAVLEVRDTGIGIDPSQHQEVFREFHQLGNPDHDRSKGLGLGLSIVSRLAQTLGHQLTLDSALNKGSVFKMRLPRADIAPSVVIEKPALPTYNFIGVGILLIEDDDIIRQTTQEQICRWGFGCTSAATIDEALSIAKAQPPQLVISDYHLRHGQTGIQAISMLRAATQESIAALLLTGDTSPESQREALLLDIPLLHKPLNPNKLHHAIVVALKARRIS